MSGLRELPVRAPAARPPDRRWWLLAAMCLAQLMVILDATIVTIALPSAQRDLGFDSADRQWVVTAYALTFGSLLLVGGRLTDFLGRRTAVLIGLVGFGLASAIGGAAPGFAVLTGARALQGVFAALLAPAILAVVTTTFREAGERNRAFGIYGGVSAAGAATGLLLGGVLTEYASWRWTLYVNLAFAAVAVLGTLTLMAHDRVRASRGYDVLGSAAITVGLFLLVLGFSSAERGGWGAASTVLCLAGGVLLLAVFVRVEQRAAFPALPLRILASPIRSGAMVVLLLGGTALFSELLFLAYYLQESLGYSPVEAGLAFLPQASGVALAATLGGSLQKRFAPGALVCAGLLLAAVGMALLSQVGTDGAYVTLVLPAVVLIGVGIGLSLILAVGLGVTGVRDEDAGVASAAVNAVQQIGGSLGPALFSTLAASATAGYVADSTPAGAALLEEAVVHGYSVVFSVAAAVLLVGAVLAAVMLRPRHSPSQAAS